MLKIAAVAAAIAVLALAAFAWQRTARVSAEPAAVMLPNGWLLAPAPGAQTRTGTMPQGMALAPDGASLAVVESGFNPPALSLYRTADLLHVATIALPGAFGKPLWLDATHVLVAGANADALLDVDVASKSVRRIALPKGSYPILVAAAPNGSTYAVACDGDKTILIGMLDTIGSSSPVALDGYPGGLAFGSDGTELFATIRSGSEMDTIDTRSHDLRRQTVALHPSALAVGGDRLYAALTDDDALGVYDARDGHPLGVVSLRDHDAPFGTIGVSPNAIFADAGTLYVTLGAANSVAVVRNGTVIGRIQAGWYPTDVAARDGQLYVLDGKGEGARPNPNFLAQTNDNTGYIGAIEYGSLRAYQIADALKAGGNPQGALGWNAGAANSVVRQGGPIRHVFFVLKENRTYDEILGDMREGNGDPAIAWFGAKVTPNEHAIAARFGLFDNAYASGEVSVPGHMWADAAFANDYVERFWPSQYGNRFDIDDLSVGDGARLPSGGFIWDAAARAHVSFRDYGELVDPGKTPSSPWSADVPTLRGKIDPRYAGWVLDYGDLARAREWRRQFERDVRAGTLPQFEFIWLPNDHTYGSKPGKPTPRAYIAQNDAALGEMIDALSHSKVWSSSAMFVTEDDAQDGPDHVSDQRTTIFVVSPYARGGVRHEHYATVSILRTMELLLGMRPLSAYDAMAVPMYAAFRRVPDLRPYDAIAPKVSLTQRNPKTAYGAKISDALDFSRPDAVPDALFNDILAHNH